MYYFTFGTYSGLFVQSQQPAALPNDLRFFDLRRRNQRAIPSDYAPNFLIRKIENDEDSECLFIALVFKVSEGSRDGFLAFGALIIDDLSPKAISEAVFNCYELASNTDLMADGQILGRPAEQNGPLIDLTELPIADVSKCFAIFEFNFYSQHSLKILSEIISEELNQKLVNFEVLFNSQNGQNMDFFDDFVFREADILTKELENRKQQFLQNGKMYKQDLNRFSRKKKRNSNLVFKFGIVLGIFSLLALIILCAWTFFSRTDVSSVRETPIDPEISCYLREARSGPC